jgi:hypothetical protein
MDLSAAETALLHSEIIIAVQTLNSALEAPDPLQTLSDLTAALDVLSATQHELVNVLVDRGATWSTIAGALSTSSAAAERRYPRRGTRSTPAGPGPGVAA